ncbi:unnamed protein product [Urochloa humidicola]
MHSQQVSESVWRMDLQSIVMAWPASTALFCVFVILHILHARKPMSMPKLAVLSLGCVALDLILSHWVFVTLVYMFRG